MYSFSHIVAYNTLSLSLSICQYERTIQEIFDRSTKGGKEEIPQNIFETLVILAKNDDMYHRDIGDVGVIVNDFGDQEATVF